MHKSIFITATDTGVGKTTVSAAICKILKDKGINVAYFKPAETGCNPTPQDAYLLSKITGQPIEEVVLYTFKNPVAPYTATLLEGKDIDIEKIKSHYRYLTEKYDFVIVEGAGGLLVPIKKNYTYLDLIKNLNIPVLIVARASLGTINHTVLTVRALEGNEIVGIVMNGFSGEDISEDTNPSIIEEMTGIPVIAKCQKTQDPISECYNCLLENINKILK